MGKASRRKRATKAGKAAVVLTPEGDTDFAQAVQRVHKWKWGQDPNDPDAEQGSGWEYVHISGDTPAETRDMRDKYKKGGGPESGYRCVCGEMTRVVDEISALEVFQQAMVIDGERIAYEFTEEQKKLMRQERLAILICPRCERITQFRADLIPSMRAKYLEEGNG